VVEAIKENIVLVPKQELHERDIVARNLTGYTLGK
jgi:hypothetical protein